MAISVFEFDSYKGFLVAWLRLQPRQGHGLRKRLAELSGCQTSHVTQVLSGNAHFSLEQAYGLVALLKLDVDETEFFITLVQYERAGTAPLRCFLEERIRTVRLARQELSNRLKLRGMPADVDQARYFSSWIYSCIHVMVTCERFRSSPALLARARGVELGKVEDVVNFLKQTGLLVESDGWMSMGQAQLHLTNESLAPG